jgi:hypothetical protein
MKKFLFIFMALLFFVAIFGSLFMLAYPWQYYKKELKKYQHVIMPKEQLRLELDPIDEKKYLNTGPMSWKTIHFQNFDILLPLKNPEIYFLPTPLWVDGQNILAGEYYHRNNIKMLSFQIRPVTTLKFDHFGQKFFREVPYAREALKKKTEEIIWQDLLKVDLHVEIPQGWFDPDSVMRYWDLWHEVGGQQLVYNYYLMIVRNQLLKDMQADNFVSSPDQSFLVFDKNEKQGLSEGLRRERMVFYLNQKIYSLELISDFKDQEAQKLREVFLSNFRFNPTNENETISLYAQFKNLSYELKLDAVGLVYLYSAWSHSVNNKKILQEIILYQEKNKDNFRFLRPFYEYTRNRYGNTLSDQVTEFDDAETKLKKNIGTEIQAENKDLKVSEIEKLKPIEKAEYFLEKAKKEKNIDVQEKVLVE